MADALLGKVVGALTPLTKKELDLIVGMDGECQKLEHAIASIGYVLQDAERKQFSDEAVRGWLAELREVAYDADDAFDECAARGLGLARGPSYGSCAGRVWSSISSQFRYLRVKSRHQMANKFIALNLRLDQIDKDKQRYNLREVAATADGQSVPTEVFAPTDSSVNTEVYGRKDETDAIVRLAIAGTSGHDRSDRNMVLKVVPIVGQGGIGKTTLAQLVCHDERITGEFEPLMWLSVSEHFEVRRMVKALIELASKESCSLVELEALQQQLKKDLGGKKFLLVLDDVWNEDEHAWSRLKSILMCGAKGSAVVVTTCSERVAKMMATGDEAPYTLEKLAFEHCWELFKEKAFRGREIEEYPNLAEMGRDIVRKCQGVPLVVSTLASLLNSKTEESEWRYVRDSEIWKLDEARKHIMPVMRLCYDRLASHLKQCFTSCSWFPKGHVLDKQFLIHMWIANGFIPEVDGKELEETGHEYFMELARRSLLQDIERDPSGRIISGKLHDLLHDVARCVLGDECLDLTEDPRQRIDPKCSVRYLYSYQHSLSKICDVLVDVSKIRNLTFSDVLADKNIDHSEFSFKLGIAGMNYISNFECLRTLDLSGCFIDELPTSVGTLLHLRYLDLSFNDKIIKLPESICNMRNLITFKLVGCGNLIRLPKKMANLRSLRHLYLHGCYNLRSTPANIGQLTSLRTLPMFVVGKNIERHGINQLRDLDLEGGLSLMGLGHVKDAEDAKRSRILNKQKLTSLALSWELSLRTRLSNSELVLDALRPHSNIEALSIDYYEGNRFPHWIKGECLPNLSCLSFICCKNCQSLPPLGELPSLEYLKMCQLKGVKRIGDELYGHNKRNSSSSSQTSASFPKLEELKITDMSNLEEWTVPQEIQAFPCLLRLSINGLPKLTNFSGLFRQCSLLTELELVGCNMLNSLEGLQYLTRLEKLKIHTSNSLQDLGQEDILSGLASLQELTIESCYGLVYLSEGMKHLTLLKKLHISGCENLEALPEGMGNLKSLTDLFIRSLSKLASIPNCLQHLTNLEELAIVNCEPMVSLKWVASFPHLRSLEIDRSESLTHLPTTLAHATSLERLKIGHCRGIEALPEWMANLSSLRILDISYCPNIKCLPDAMRTLTTLESLWIFGASPELMRRCKKGEGEDWYKIEHIPYSSITG